MKKTVLGKHNGYFPALTGVRALAAYMVFIHHYKSLINVGNNAKLSNFLNELHVGVTLFFVLSGFLIAYKYFESGRGSFKTYIVNRFAKIYPVYFILTTITFIAYAIYRNQNYPVFIPVYLFNITFIRGFFELTYFTGVSQGWSLTVEEMFYFLAPFFFILIRKNRNWLYLIPLLFLLMGFMIVDLFKGNTLWRFMPTNTFMLDYTFFGRCTEFFTGITLALIVRNNTYKLKWKGFTYAGLILTFYWIYLISTFNENNVPGIAHPLGKLINTFLMPVTGISLFYYGLITEKTLVSKILGSRLFVTLGKSSYAFYLIHIGVTLDLLALFTKNPYLIFVIMVGLSYLIYRWVEKPFDRLIRKKLGGN